MLKNTIFLFFIPLSLFAQENIIVDYGVDYIEYHVNEKDTAGFPEAVKSQLAQQEKLKEKALEGDQSIFVLKTDNNVSNFKFKDFMGMDDGGANFATLFIAASLSPLIKVDDQLFLERDFLKSERSYEFYDLEIDWEIKDEYKEILGFKCQLAEAEMPSMTYPDRTYKAKAWFTNEIPIPEGPSYFKGLPGLIH